MDHQSISQSINRSDHPPVTRPPHPPHHTHTPPVINELVNQSAHHHHTTSIYFSKITTSTIQPQSMDHSGHQVPQHPKPNHPPPPPTTHPDPHPLTAITFSNQSIATCPFTYQAIKSRIITDGLKYSLATGNWGDRTTATRAGVSQVLHMTHTCIHR